MADEFDKSLQAKQDEFDAELKKLKPPESPGEHPGEFLKYAAGVVPQLLPIIGTAIGASGGPIGGAAGAGLGRTAAIELQNELPGLFGKPPKDLAELLTSVAGDAALGGIGVKGAGSTEEIGAAAKGAFKGIKDAGHPRFYSDILPWGMAGEGASLIGLPVGWRSAAAMGIASKYIKAGYKGARSGLQDLKDSKDLKINIDPSRYYERDQPSINVDSESSGPTGMSDTPNIPTDPRLRELNPDPSIPKALADKIQIKYQTNPSEPTGMSSGGRYSPNEEGNSLPSENRAEAPKKSYLPPRFQKPIPVNDTSLPTNPPSFRLNQAVLDKMKRRLMGLE